ncbi:MAG: hypothetical protein JKY62_06610 [Desulfocapsa sp.]|nr:hypothetical protein [Desulfocapsa sp.]
MTVNSLQPLKVVCRTLLASKCSNYGIRFFAVPELVPETVLLLGRQQKGIASFFDSAQQIGRELHEMEFLDAFQTEISTAMPRKHESDIVWFCAAFWSFSPTGSRYFED